MTPLIKAVEALIQNLEAGIAEPLSKAERHHMRQELIETVKEEVKRAKSDHSYPLAPYDQTK